MEWIIAIVIEAVERDVKRSGKKMFLVEADLGEGIPTYTFIVKADTLEEANKVAGKIIKTDYPENWEYNKDDYSVHEVDAEQLIERLTIN